MMISTHSLTTRAREYFGGDVQTFWCVRADSEYLLYQRPHWGNTRIAARSYAPNAAEAMREFNAMAAQADTDHC